MVIELIFSQASYNIKYIWKLLELFFNSIINDSFNNW